MNASLSRWARLKTRLKSSATRAVAAVLGLLALGTGAAVLLVYLLAYSD